MIQLPINEGQTYVIAKAVKRAGKTVGHKVYKSDGTTQLTEQDYNNYVQQCMNGEHVLVLLEQQHEGKTVNTMQGLFSSIFKVKGLNS